MDTYLTTLNDSLMKINIKIIALLFLASAAMVACDTDGEQNFEFEPGNTLFIEGTGEVSFNDVLADASTNSYYVRGFTINEEYSWTLDGQPIEAARGGEFVFIDFAELGPGVYELTVDNGTFTGTKEIAVLASPREASFVDTTNVTVTESAAFVAVPVVISGRGAAVTTRVEYELGGTARVGTDYRVVSPTPLLFEAGQVSDTVVLEILNNTDINEEGETIMISLIDVESDDEGVVELGATLSDSTFLTTKTITIMDDVEVIALADTDTLQLSSPNQADTYSFPVTLSEPAEAPVTVTYEVRGEGPFGMAQGITDVTGGSITIDAGATTRNIVLDITNEAFDDDEKFVLEITGFSTADEEVTIGQNEAGENINVTKVISIDVEE